jgi:CheY-like chemotaxis protein
LGGEISVQSELGIGTTFTIDLPSAVPASPQEQNAAPAACGGTERILLVEDEAAVRSVVRETLEIGGYRVEDAASGIDALAWAATQEQPPDLLISDVVMPAMGGKEFAQRFLERWPGVPVLFISGYSDDVVAARGKLLETAHMVHKPFSGDDLFRAVRAALDSKAG